MYAKIGIDLIDDELRKEEKSYHPKAHFQQSARSFEQQRFLSSERLVDQRVSLYSKNRRETEVGKLGWHGNFGTGMENNTAVVSFMSVFERYFQITTS